MAVATIGAMGAMFSTSASAADSTSWLCKPGQADNPCLGKFGGNSNNADGSVTDLGYDAKADPPVDCFYVYPTQSEQDGANADLNPDQELKDVAVNQARMFSRVCDVYAPLYRQYTFKAPITDEVRDTAYAGVLQGWKDYLENYNNGRGVILIGHSQGSSHLGRLMQEEIDNNAEVRSHVISAIIPGANVFVPKGKKVGGEFQNIPACETDTQLGCVIAYSAYLNEPPVGASFGRIASGYWINPMPRPDPALYEVLCVDPSDLTGGSLDPLANLAVFTGQPEGDKPWLAQPDYYSGDCMNQNDASWLNVSRITTTPPDNRLDLANIIKQGGGNLHLGDINLAEDNLVSIASTQSEAYLARADALKKLGIAKKKLAAAKKALVKSTKSCKKATKAAKKAAKKSKAAGKRAKKLAKKKCRPVAPQAVKVGKLKAQVKKYTKLSQV